MIRVLVVSPRLPSVSFRARTQTTSAGIASSTKNTIPTVRDPGIRVRIALRKTKVNGTFPTAAAQRCEIPDRLLRNLST
jgi:hypothetical protein